MFAFGEIPEPRYGIDLAGEMEELTRWLSAPHARAFPTQSLALRTH